MRSPIPHVIFACAFLSAACLSGGGPAAARGLASESMDATERLGQLGADIVARERRLRATRSQLQSQRRAVAGARVRLASSEDKLKRLSFAAQKISREPTPSIFLHPDKPLDAARSAMLLRRLSREIAKSRQEAEEEMERLQTEVGAQERAEALLIADLHALRRKESEVRRVLQRIQKKKFKQRAAEAPVTRPKKPAAPVATKKPSPRAPAKTPPLSVASKQPKPQKPPKPAATAAKPAQTVSAQTSASPTKPAKPKTTKLKTATKPAPSGREKPAPKSVAKLRESAKAAAAPPKRKTAPPAQPKPALSKLEVSQRRALKNKAFSKSRGLLVWPAAADMRRTGRKRDPGITFFTEPYARVISPCYGVVRHVGAFGSGEKIVIIEPQKGYSILISGLAAVDLRKGQKVAAGQPIGRMGGPEQWREEFLIEGRTGAMKRSEKLDLEIYRKERSLNAAAWFRPATERVSGL